LVPIEQVGFLASNSSGVMISASRRGDLQDLVADIRSVSVDQRRPKGKQQPRR
jgi:hypothetical protein